MARHYYLKLAGIKGAVTIKGPRQDTTEISSFSWGLAGQDDPDLLTVGMHADKSSPLILGAMSTGQSIASAVIMAYEPEVSSGITFNSFTLTFTGVTIVHHEVSVHGSGVLMDSVHMHYTGVDLNYPPNDASWAVPA